MTYARGADAYKSRQVSTAGPAELVAMLFDAVVTNARLGAAALEAGTREAAHDALVKAQDIVLELRCSLNSDAGEVAAGLDQLYGYVMRRLVEANVQADPAAAREAADLIEPIQTAWRQSCLGGAEPVGARGRLAAQA